MSVVETGGSGAFSKEGGNAFSHGEIELVDMGHDLLTPTSTIIVYTEMLLEYIEKQADCQEFISDLNKMLTAGEQLSALITQLFSKKNSPHGQLDLESFTSTIRHNLRTPINAIIGYGEMLLEDIDTSMHQEASLDLQKILTSARRLLTLIGDLSYVSKKPEPATKEAEKKPPGLTVPAPPSTPKKQVVSTSPVPKSQSQPSVLHSSAPSVLSTDSIVDDLSANDNELVDVGHELLTPTSTIIVYTEMLLEYAEKQADCQDFIPDLNKMLTAGEQLSALITQLFSKKNSSNGQLDHESFSSTVRHNLRTPINAIIGYGEMLLEDIDTSEHQEASVDLQKILASARRLLALIGDLTYYSKPQEPAAKNKPESEPKPTVRPSIPKEPVELTLRPSQARTPIPQQTPALLESSIDDVIELATHEATLLVVDDGDSNRDLLKRRLDKQGFKVDVAENGRKALQMIREKTYDLILLDILMPEMNGYQVLAELKADKELSRIPIIMISALDEIDGVVRCIEMGAEDYLQKPFNQVILNAKISASLERKRLRDREREFMRRLQDEQQKSEKLLLNILPQPIAERLKKGEHTIADSFSEVTVLFSDLVGFTELSTGIEPSQLVEKLNLIFLAFDRLTEKHGLEKIKTIGDAYMLVGGLPTPRQDHVEAVADMALDMLREIDRLNETHQANFNIRVGIHTGPVVAGVIGKNKFNYDLWGDTVNIASRMESQGVAGCVQLSETTYNRIKEKFILERRGPIEVKGKGQMVTYLLRGRKN
jgi:adenylate cyclase